ncbi:ABC transporter ATP-binding protein [Paenibacillus kobensis]|uniref:ABC transporter ATP-binding protein n=1 Tax=Paenibacillus kobensis TaxID=59841 RepID=UPI000FD93AB9|nr:ABC transporter ATP-binding protein [Paenibacillus kobensis]
MEEGTVLDICGLSKTYKNKRGVDRISIQVSQGDVYGLFGPNGAGKTTVMKAATGLMKADQGIIRLFGHDVAVDHEAAMNQVGVLIEKPALLEYMTGYKNLELAARLYPRLPKARIDEALALVGLEAHGREKVAHYSLGMKQRLGIASALLSKPRLLILDEPTNGLDIEGMIEMRSLIAQLAREERMTFFLSSHLITEMELVCNRIGIVYGGRLIQEGTIDELLQSGGQTQSLESFYVSRIQAVREEERNGAVEAGRR